MAAQRIFISHSHVDNDFGLKLVQDLRRIIGEQDSVWFDTSGGLHGGDVWWRKIVDEITARPVFMVILSPEALNSPWVRDEVNLAWNMKNTKGKQLIPVIYRACNVWPDLQTLQMISFLPPKQYQASLADLLIALNVALPSELRSVTPAVSLSPGQSATASPAQPQVGRQSPNERPLIREILKSDTTIAVTLGAVGGTADAARGLFGSLRPSAFGAELQEVGWMGGTAERAAFQHFLNPYSMVVVVMCLALWKLKMPVVAIRDTKRGAVIQAIVSSLGVPNGTITLEIDVVDAANTEVRATTKTQGIGSGFMGGRNLKQVFSTAGAYLKKA